MTVSVNKRITQTAQSKSTTTEFDQLFQIHWSRVYSVVYRLVGDPEEAEDLALEAFLRLNQHPPRDENNLAGWLYRVATNLGLNALRAQTRRTGYEAKGGMIAFEDARPSNPAREVELAEERQQVRLTLFKMKKRSAKILILRHSGFSYSEIAKVIGVSSSSVGTLVARAEEEFKKRYPQGNRT